MDDVLSQILDACKLAKELDASIRLSAVPIDPHYLSSSCDDIAAAFSSAALRLHSLAAPAELPPSYAPQMLFGEPPPPPPPAEDDIRNNIPFYAPRLALDIPLPGDAGRIGAAEGGSSSPAQRSSRKRKEGTVARRVPALRTGNLDIPPDDGYTWRKYGQKDILNSMFPRSYYRCTHKSYYGCEAKKQVQRLDEDPNIFEVTYCGTHTCQTSPTPILIPTQLLPPAAEANDEDASLTQLEPMPQQQPAAAASQSASPSIELHNWLERSNPASLGTLLDFAPGGGGSSSSRRGGGQAQQGGGRDVEGTSVAELADAMFNSGSSGSSMDVIFSPRHRK